MTFFHQLFDLRKCGPELGDCTAPYDVIFRLTNRHPTVNQFLSSVIAQKNEWGRINISPNKAKYKTLGNLLGYCGKVDTLDYRRGKWGKGYDSFVEKYGDRKIESATADGGWNLIDYLLILEDDDPASHE